MMSVNKEAKLWWAVRVLDNAVAFLQEDAGSRDVEWTDDLQQATEILSKRADKLRSKLKGK